MNAGVLRGAKVFRNTRGKKPDKSILAVFVLMIVTGLVVLTCASFYNASLKGSVLTDVVSQLIGIMLGLTFMLIIWKLDISFLSKPVVSGWLLGISFLMLILVAIPGIGVYINGSRRWLRIGPVSFQPSELAKYSLVLFMARVLSSPRRDVTDFFKGLIPLFVVPGCMFLLILLQPNLSTAGSIVITSAVMTMIAGARWLHLTLIGVCGLIVGTYYALSEPYRRARMISFIDPFKYFSNEGYQLAQSLMAFGSGGWFGMGLGRGKQKYSFLPYPESDFIFAVVGEDMGFIGCLLIMGLFMAFLFFGYRICIREKDRFKSMLCAGIVSTIGVQTILNIAVVIGVMPTTGLPLPFFSAGGTSVSIVMGAVGILLNVSSDQNTL
ncbi:MAG: putative lipid II flippase FtsW [Clostridia bacterium]|nr:putative lipid II flippase FtsW [Clostridia bacterium]MBQ2433590.1 putative lipid II flippase FtsW [Clostridia bacterium]